MDMHANSLCTVTMQRPVDTVHRAATSTSFGNPCNLHTEAAPWLDRYDPTANMHIHIAPHAALGQFSIAAAEPPAQTIPLSLGECAAAAGGAALLSTSCIGKGVAKDIYVGLIATAIWALGAYLLHRYVIKPRRKRKLIEKMDLEAIPLLGAHAVVREEALEALKEKLAAGTVVSIEGMPGSGKTYLAAQLAGQLKREEKRPVYWHTFHWGTQPNVGMALDNLALFLDRQFPKDTKGLYTSVHQRERAEGKASLVTHALHTPAIRQSSLLLVFDNFHHVMQDEGSARIFTSLVQDGIGDSTTLKVVTITREYEDWLEGINAQRWHEKGMTEDEARTMLARVGVREAIIDEHFKLLYEKTGGLPQCAFLFGEAVRTRTEPEIQDVIDHIRNRDRSVVLGYLLRIIYEQLSPGEQRLMDCLSIFRKPVPLDAITSVADTQDGRIKYRLSQFRESFLVEEQRPGHYKLHDSLKSLADAYIDDRAALHRKAADYYARNSQEPGDTVEAAHHYFEAGEYDEAVEAIAGKTTDLLRQGYPNELRDLLARFDKTVPLTDASRGRVYYERGLFYHFLNDHNEALKWLNISSGIYARLPKSSEELECYRESLTIYRELGDRREEVLTYDRMGGIHEIENEYCQALECYRKGLIISQDLGDWRHEQEFYCRMGLSHEALEDWDEALECYRKSLGILKEFDDGDRSSEAFLHFHMGRAYRSLHKWNEALDCFATSGKIFNELGYSIAAADMIRNMGSVYSLQNQRNNALSCYETSIELYKEFDNRQGVTIVLWNIAKMYKQDSLLFLKIGDLGNEIIKSQGAPECYDRIARILRDLKAAENG